MIIKIAECDQTAKGFRAVDDIPRNAALKIEILELADTMDAAGRNGPFRDGTNSV